MMCAFATVNYTCGAYEGAECNSNIINVLHK